MLKKKKKKTIAENPTCALNTTWIPYQFSLARKGFLLSPDHLILSLLSSNLWPLLPLSFSADSTVLCFIGYNIFTKNYCMFPHRLRLAFHLYPHSLHYIIMESIQASCQWQIFHLLSGFHHEPSSQLIGCHF